MSRSVKKGPFVEARLLGRVQEMNKRNERKVIKHLVARVGRLPRLHRAHRSPSTTAASTCPSSSPRTWSVIASGEFAPTRTFRGHEKKTDRSASLR